MKAKDLIVELQKLHPDTEIHTLEPGSGYELVTDIVIVTQDDTEWDHKYKMPKHTRRTVLKGEY